MRVQQIAELGRGDVEDRRACGLGGACAVDEGTDPTELVDTPLDQRVGDGGVGWRTGVPDGATTDAVDRLRDRGGVTSVDDDPEALSDKLFGDRQADAARAADDDRSVVQLSSCPNCMASMFQ